MRPLSALALACAVLASGCISFLHGYDLAASVEGVVGRADLHEVTGDYYARRPERFWANFADERGRLLRVRLSTSRDVVSFANRKNIGIRVEWRFCDQLRRKEVKLGELRSFVDTTATMSISRRRLPPADRQGRFHYDAILYVRDARPTEDGREAYDLVQAPQDMCVRLELVAMVHVYRTNFARIPKEEIAVALGGPSADDLAAFEDRLAGEPAGRIAARAALRRLVAEADEDALEGYLARHPRGAGADLARERLPAAAWEAVGESDEVGVLWDYLREHPGTAHEAEARRRLRAAIDESTNADALDALARGRPTSALGQQAKRRSAALSWSAVSHSLRASDFDDFLRRHPDSREAAHVPGAKAALERLAAIARAQFATVVEKYGFRVGRDCWECPEMAVVPAGTYRMGPADWHSDPHEVAIGAPFAVGRHEVTFAQWDACARDGGCPRGEGIADDEGWGRGRRPAINVSWNDAQSYVRWLSRKTGKPYRLPSESEWEYAARAGAETEYSWGDRIGVDRANCGGCGSRWDRRRTAPAGSFAANAWGLHDMHGNAWEWVEDCWNDSYAAPRTRHLPARESPRDGSAWLGGDCSERVLRGGAWASPRSYLRSAYRFRGSSSYRHSDYGFRVARTLAP